MSFDLIYPCRHAACRTTHKSSIKTAKHKWVPGGEGGVPVHQVGTFKYWIQGDESETLEGAGVAYCMKYPTKSNGISARAHFHT